MSNQERFDEVTCLVGRSGKVYRICGRGPLLTSGYWVNCNVFPFDVEYWDGSNETPAPIRDAKASVFLLTEVEQDDRIPVIVDSATEPPQLPPPRESAQLPPAFVGYAAPQPKKVSSLQVDGNHYKGMGIEPVDVGLANNLDCLQFSIVKHAMRHPHKNEGVVDLKKVVHYALMALEKQYGVTGTMPTYSDEPAK